jgi:hypothetical protein
VLWEYSKDLQEKKGHIENRKVIEILQAFLDTMIQAKPSDSGATNEFGILVNSTSGTILPSTPSQ